MSEGRICNPISGVGENDVPSDVTLPTSHGEFNTEASAAPSDRLHPSGNIVDMWRKYSGGYPWLGIHVNVSLPVSISWNGLMLQVFELPI